MIKPLISVIIPIYNVEEYLKDAIESVINQSIGFNNIELILVNDGSTDNSGSICEYYTNKYPENVIYKKLKNGGVSRARNTGYGLATGKYIHFLDGDDIISRNFYKKSVDFLKKHSKEIDFVASKLMFFDEIIDSHPLNFKFKKDRVIDLSVEPNSPILHVTSCVFIRKSIDKIRFDTKLSIAEDVTYINEVLLRKRKYGVLKSTKYYYRKRQDGSSALGGQYKNKNNYIDVVNHAYKRILNNWRGYGYNFADYTILYDLSYRLTQKKQDVLSREQEDEYKKEILSLSINCSDESIISNDYLSVHQKVYILKNKYGNDYIKHIKLKEKFLYFKDYFLTSIEDSIYIDFITKHKHDTYTIEGYVTGLVDDSLFELKAVVGKEEYRLVNKERVQREVGFFGDIYDNGGSFEVNIELPVNSSIEFFKSINNNQSQLKLETGPYTRLATTKWAYRNDSERLIQKNNNRIISKKYKYYRHINLELRMLTQIVLNWNIKKAAIQYKKLMSRNLDQLSYKSKIFEILKPAFIIGETVIMIPRALFLRIFYYIIKAINKRPVWIVSDRPMSAGDNGEAFYRYTLSKKDCPAEVYFAISKKSGDYLKIKEISRKVINHGGLHYKLKFLLASNIISSHADIEVTNPFLRQIDHYVDLFNFRFIFLQHGIIRNDLSGWLNRFDKNISLFVTSAEKEYNSIINYPYYYDKKDIIKTGLPRYDLLENSPKNKIIIAPTYRKSLLRQKTNKLGVRNHDSLFVKSAYFKFYNRLINDKRLISAMTSNDFSGEFYVHPNFSSQISDFCGNDVFKVINYPYNYKKAISEGSILVSDYSSLVFDFAYLNKPVIYSQFDIETFFESHSYSKGDFFSDKNDGFGPVAREYNKVVDEIIDAISNKCVVEPRYKQRADKFFIYRDRNNSKRVYEKIISELV